MVKLEQTWWSRDPTDLFHVKEITVPTGLTDTYLLGIAGGYFNNTCEDMKWKTDTFTRLWSMSNYAYYNYTFCKMYGMKNPEPGTGWWTNIWYADDARGVMALLLFSGVDQDTPVGVISRQGAANNDPTVLIDSAVGDLCVGGFCRLVPNPVETLSLVGDETSLLDVSSTVNVLWRLKVVSALAVSTLQSMGLTSDTVTESATMGIAIKPSVYDSIPGNSQPFLFM